MSSQETQFSAEAQAIHTQLMTLISQKIKANNQPISFADYMQMALYAPSLGYYQNGLQKFGAEGDFITAPEMGDLFACGLVNALLSVEPKLSKNLLEIGAGTGQLAADILSLLDEKNAVPDFYYILEPSASLQSQQYQTLQKQVPKLLDKVVWLSQLSENFSGVIFANEVIDAIPCERIQKDQQGWMQLGVSIRDKKLEWANIQQVDNKVLPPILLGDEYLQGYTTEIRPLVEGWISGLANCLAEGIIFLFDYGYSQSDYYHPQRDKGTLKCFSRHQAHNQALELSGLQDITAHVDFTDVAMAAVKAGLTVEGFTTQAGFLLENGILDRAKLSFNQQGSAESYLVSQQIQKLTTPGQMGEVIKVIALSKKNQTCPQGFKLQDQLHRL